MEMQNLSFTKGSAVAPVEDFLVSMWMFVLFCTSFMSCYICNRIVRIHIYIQIYIYIYMCTYLYHIWAPIFQVSQLWYQKSRLFVTDVTSAGHCSLWVESSTRSRTRGTGCSGTVLPLVVWGIMKSPVFIGIPWNQAIEWNGVFLFCFVAHLPPKHSSLEYFWYQY